LHAIAPYPSVVIRAAASVGLKGFQ
jgi:hypothetical protein